MGNETKPIFFSERNAATGVSISEAFAAAGVAGLENSRSLGDFYAACAPLGQHQSERFLHLELDIVNRCNIRCVMCYHSLEATRVPIVFLNPALFSMAAAQILPYASHLSLSLGNEPLMSPHFEEMLRIAAPYKIPHINFFTNGLLLTDKKIAAIIDSGVAQVCISIDGATAATYNAIRRGGDFDELIRNVERLISLRNQAGSLTPRVRFDFVMMRRNIRELPDVVRLAARLGVEQMCMRHMVSFAGLDIGHESLVHAKALSNYWLARALEDAAELGLEMQTHPAFFTDEPAPAAESKAISLADLPTPYCPFPFFHIAMGPGGHVWPCPHAHGEAPYGQVSAEMPLDEIWLGEKFMALRSRILSRDPPDMCLRCPFLADHYPNFESLFATREHNAGKR